MAEEPERSLASELAELNQLKSEGKLSDSDYAILRRRLMPHQRKRRVPPIFAVATVALVAASGVGAWWYAQSDARSEASAPSSERFDDSATPSTAVVVRTTPSATTTTAPASRATPISTQLAGEAAEVLEWLETNQSAIAAFGSAQQAFEGAIFSDASNDAVGRASIDLYNALIDVPRQPAYIPESQRFNTWLVSATSAADVISDYYLVGDEAGMLVTILEWDEVSRQYASWFGAISDL